MSSRTPKTPQDAQAQVPRSDPAPKARIAPGTTPGQQPRATAPSNATSTPDPATKVRRRRVFYVPGYDPFHPRRYRELYRSESGAQAGISGYTISQQARPGRGRPYGWSVRARIEDADVETEVDVLVWSDIVRDSMGHSIASTYLQLVRTAWTYLTTGALFRLMRLRKGPVIAALYPVAFLLLQLALAGGVGFALGSVFNWAAPAANLGGFSPWIGVIIGLGTVPLVLAWFKRRDNRFFAYYLMHDYSYSARNRGASTPELATRQAQFARAIREALAADTVDEVLVVGHSSGAHMAISVLADVIRGGLPAGPRPVLSLLTLGQVVPMVSFLPDAGQLRGDLAYLSERDELFWLDVSAPGDGCAFALCDPVAVTGVAPAAKRWPLVLSAAFTQTLSPDRWAELRWRFFRLHFQYLCAFDRPGDYDYFRITAGPATLAARFAHRSPSESRIERPVSGYRDMTTVGE